MARREHYATVSGHVVVAAGALPPLEPDDGDLVAPADAIEQADELARVPQ